jgi:hypothetical protein
MVGTHSEPELVVVLQLEELLLDEPENQDYQGLYHDVQEVRCFL